MSGKMKTGAVGEKLAAEFLIQQGYTIVERNFRWKKGEIDLIAQRENWMIFVEVKTRGSDSYGPPESFVSDLQRMLIYDAAEEYIFKIDWHGHIRFDIISVSIGPEPEIVVFEDAINY